MKIDTNIRLRSLHSLWQFNSSIENDDYSNFTIMLATVSGRVKKEAMPNAVLQRNSSGFSAMRHSVRLDKMEIRARYREENVFLNLHSFSEWQ
jgi:hypothetical protein